MLNKFIEINRRFCNKFAELFPQKRINIFTLYEKVVGQYMNAKNNQIVIDVGGGKSCPFIKHKNTHANNKIIAIDLSLEELQQNSEVDGRVVANIISEMPFQNNSVDLTVSRSVLEHLTHMERFIANSKSILKNNGYLIHLFPSKFAPFAIINQLLPKKLAKKILFSLRPETLGIGGFPAFYDRCYYSSILSLLQKYNFEPIDIRVSYYQSEYFSFFTPLFLAVALYEMVVYSLKWKNLGAYILVTAQKKEQ
jgi:ubiquinone/menaquinone biosynthesis C-methylase UbiE